jgi:hypothetical protein
MTKRKRKNNDLQNRHYTENKRLSNTNTTKNPVNKVNKVKIMSGCVCVWEGVMSRSDCSPFCIPVNKVKIIAEGGYVWK